MASRWRRAGSRTSKSALQSPAPSENTALLHARSAHDSATSIVCAASARPETVSLTPRRRPTRRTAGTTVSGRGRSMCTGSVGRSTVAVVFGLSTVPLAPPHPLAASVAPTSAVAAWRRWRRRDMPSNDLADEAVPSHAPDDQLSGDRGAGDRQVHAVRLSDGHAAPAEDHRLPEPPARGERPAEVDEVHHAGERRRGGAERAVHRPEDAREALAARRGQEQPVDRARSVARVRAHHPP